MMSLVGENPFLPESCKKKTKVLASDSHIQDAIEEIVHKYKLREFLSCIKYREYEKSFKFAS